VALMILRVPKAAILDKSSAVDLVVEEEVLSE
jgi:hypothetical protein